jgi:hypothetical protein
MAHIGDVHDVPDGITVQQQGAPQQIDKDVSPQVADVSEVIHRRPARVESDQRWMQRLKIARTSCEGIV